MENQQHSNQKRILRLDASALAKSSCLLRLKYIVIDGWRNNLLYNDTVYGLAGHKFLATMALTNSDIATSVREAKLVFNQPKIIRRKKEHLTENHFIKTCFDYWEHLSKTDEASLIISPDSKLPLVEQKFSIVAYEDDTLIIEIVGTLDKLVKYGKQGQVCIGDYKFTSSWNQAEYFPQHRLAPQLKTYRWMLYKFAEVSSADSFLRELTKYPVGMFIDGIFLKSAKETEFHRSEVWTPKQAEIEEFDASLQAMITKLAYLYHEKWSRRDGMINGSCSNSYGSTSASGALCQFYTVCSACDTVAAQHVLKNNFIQKEYDPLAFGEV